MEIISIGTAIPLLFLLSGLCSAIDTITTTQIIQLPETVVSNGSAFELGFFSPDESSNHNHYVGIWYGTPSFSTVIWVANRDKPLNDSSGILTVSEDGNLVVLNGQKEIVWSSNVSNSAPNSTAQLLDSGNLVLRDNNGSMRWESIQHPSHSLLPKMKISTNTRTGERVVLTSWKSLSDPSTGSFSAGLNPMNTGQLFIWKGSDPYWRSGPWNGQVFVGIPNMNSYVLNGFQLVDDDEGESYISFSVANSSLFLHYVLTPDGTLEENQGEYGEEELEVTWRSNDSSCDVYGTCGAFGICDSRNSPICSCLRGYDPKSVEEWNRGNWTSGCVRKTPLQCERNGSFEEGNSDGFFKLTTVKVPDYEEPLPVVESECRDICLNNCSCIAYSYYDGIGCMSWSRNLIDLQTFSSNGADLYIRVADTELDEKGNVKVIIAAVVVSGTIAIICTYFSCRWWIARKRARVRTKELGDGVSLFERGNVHKEFSDANLFGNDVSQVKLDERLLINFEKLVTATNNFHEANKLGQGGFGSVYRGKLPEGQEVAVKRLSRTSAQGIEEFLNEVMVISNVQHRNLVRLLGCCTEGAEKMLVYEYLPNKSLDAFLCDDAKRISLTWRRRFSIIEGIARGLQYLHRDSRLRIIHRDLKPSNILLDEDMNPKISDFGMARIFEGKQDKANTVRIAGTYGYMPPEYAMEGIFSEKSDVFSFGVLILEIISGIKSVDFYHEERWLSLAGYGWKLWREGNMEAFIDGSIAEESFQGEILRCIQVALLCTQELAKDRPSISVVLSMICSEIVHLPPPMPPAYSERRITLDTESSGSQKLFSVNRVTVTGIQGR